MNSLNVSCVPCEKMPRISEWQQNGNSNPFPAVLRHLDIVLSAPTQYISSTTKIVVVPCASLFVGNTYGFRTLVDSGSAGCGLRLAACDPRPLSRRLLVECLTSGTWTTPHSYETFHLGDPPRRHFLNCESSSVEMLP